MSYIKNYRIRFFNKSVIISQQFFLLVKLCTLVLQMKQIDFSKVTEQMPFLKNSEVHKIPDGRKQGLA